ESAPQDSPIPPPAAASARSPAPRETARPTPAREPRSAYPPDREPPDPTAPSLAASPAPRQAPRAKRRTSKRQTARIANVASSSRPPFVKEKGADPPPILAEQSTAHNLRCDGESVTRVT